MANTIKLKRKSDADGAPTTGDLVAGELALNTFSGRVFLEKSDGGAAIVELIHDQGGQTIGGALTITGAFTSLGIDDNATKEVVQITDNGINLGDGTAAETYLLSIRDVTTGRLTISGGSGTTNGANIALFGETAAGTPGDTQFKTGSVAWQTFDESAGEWTLSTNVKASRADAITVPSSGVVRLNQTLRMTERADHIETPAATFGEIWLRNDAIQSLVFTDDAGTDHDLTAGGFSGLGVWRYSTTTSSTPATGRLQFDNTTIDSATEMYIHDTNDDGTDVNAFLALVEAGDLVYVQVKADSSQFAIVHVGTPSLLSDVFTFPIIDVEYQGSAPSNNTRVTVVTSHGSTGGAGNVTKVGTPVDNQVGVWTGDGTIEGDTGFTYVKDNITSPMLTLTANASMTSGSLFQMVSNVSTKTNFLLNVRQEHASSSADCINCVNDGTGNGIEVQVGTATGSAARFYSNTASRTQPLVEIVNDNATGAGDALYVQNDSATGKAILTVGDVAVGDGTDASPVLEVNSTLTGNPIITLQQDGNNRGTLTYLDTGDIFEIDAVASGAEVRIQTNSADRIIVSSTAVTLSGDLDPTVTNTQDIGASGLIWANVWATTFNGTATTAQYADLAEKYLADADYEVGTVVSFGGDKEITQSDEYLDHRIAGIVSADPAFLMNVNLAEGTTVALRGRIPCKVFGDIKKGDLLVSKGDGTACAVEPLEARAGTILGKALENFTGEYGVIEVVV